MESAVSRTYKDSKVKQEINKALREKKSGPHKTKKKGLVVCPDCEGRPDAMSDNEGRIWTCPTCTGMGEVVE